MLNHAMSALGPVAAVLTPRPGRTALHVGAGDGRDAALLVALGYEVVAVGCPPDEPPHAPMHWIEDTLPHLARVQRLVIGFDLIVLGAAWTDIAAHDRAPAFRKLATLLKPGGQLIAMVCDFRYVRELEALARVHGLAVLRCAALDGETGAGAAVCLALPDDGSGALPVLRGIILNDEKASTYKLALLRAVARIADAAPGAAMPDEIEDSVSLPLGLVALYWVRQYLPLVAGGLPQLPGNHGSDRLSFAKDGFRRLLSHGTPAQNLRIGAVFHGLEAAALVGALAEARRTITDMPANFTRLADGGRVFAAAPSAMPRPRGALTLDLPTLYAHGTLGVPGPVWRALQRLGAWVEPVLLAEWARKIRRYGHGMGRTVLPGEAEAALTWLDPLRDTTLAREAVQRLTRQGRPVHCVWTGARLAAGQDRPNIDHCLPWSAAPCGDLWNLLPASRRVNQTLKGHRLPSAAALAGARPAVLDWWEWAWQSEPDLARRFQCEASAALPVPHGATLDEVFAGLEWRRLRLRQDQQIDEWAGVR